MKVSYYFFITWWRTHLVENHFIDEIEEQIQKLEENINIQMYLEFSESHGDSTVSDVQDR